MLTYTDHQLLPIHIRKHFCDGKSVVLAGKIGISDTYANRLFYPLGKAGRKGIGLKIMQSCTNAFSLPAGFWEINPTDLPSIGIGNQVGSSAQFAPVANAERMVNEPENKSFYGWPFSSRITPHQYKLLNSEEKIQIENYILLHLHAKDPPTEQIKPAYTEITGTHG